jgi:hypothetical protein
MQAMQLDKFAGVVSDQRCLLAKGVGGDHGVERANRSAAVHKASSAATTLHSPISPILYCWKRCKTAAGLVLMM